MNLRRKSHFLLCLPILFVGLAARQGQQTKPNAPQAQPSAQPAALSPDRPRFEFGGNAAAVPATFIQDLVFLPANVNQSQPSLFLLDTRSPGTSIDPARAADTGAPTDRRVALILPGVMFPLDVLPTLPRAEFSAETGRPYEGTIGEDLLSRVVLEIDYARQTVRAFDPAIYKYSGKGKIFPLTLVNGMPVIRAKMVTPRGKQVETDFGIDTALLAGVAVSAKFSEAHKVFPSHGKIVQAYDPQLVGGESVSLFRLRNFEIAQWVAADTIAELSRSALSGADNPKIAGVMGAALLRRFNLVLDYPHQQIIFEANTHLKDYAEEDKSGIAVVAKGSNLRTFEIVHVVPGTPAAAAGIRAGDVIAGINDEPAADISLASLRDMFRQVGHTYKILIQRGDQTKQVSVQMRRLL
jgi:membrane-associated protease RseP (regulator of RpoE activity)